MPAVAASAHEFVMIDSYILPLILTMVTLICLMNVCAVHLDGCQDLYEQRPAVSLEDVDHGSLTCSHLLRDGVHGFQDLKRQL